MSTSRVASAIAEAIRFLGALDPGAPSWTFQTFDDTPAKRPELAATRHGTFEQYADWLAAQNARGAGAFVTINETDGQGRKASNIIRVRALFADFDNPAPGTLERLGADSLPPSIIVESSTGKWHAYWLVEGLALADFKPLQQRIAEHWGSDPQVCDLPRVMRLPGFQHCKGAPQAVRLIEATGMRYGIELVNRYAAEALGMEAIQMAKATDAGNVSAYAAAVLESACKAVAGAPQGSRNHTLNREAFGIAQLVACGDLPEVLARDHLHAAALRAGLGSVEALSTLQSAFNAGTAQPRVVATGTFQRAAAPASPVLVEVPLTDVMSAGVEPVRFAVKPWMPRRHVTLFGGHGGVGKSSIALAIAAHVACGRSFAGMEVEKAPVLFVSLEDEASIVRLRLRRIIEAYQLPAAQVLEGLRLMDGTQASSALMSEGDGSNPQPVFTEAFRELGASVKGAGLIIVDNASDAFDANENSRRAVRAFMRGLAGIARRNDAAVVLLAHIDKSAARSNANGNSYSGSTAWHNSARSRLALLDEGGRVSLAHEKANLSARTEPVRIAFVDGVPMPEAASRGNGLIANDFDQAEMVRALRAAHEAGVQVTGAMAGPNTAIHALENLPEFGAEYRSREGKKRAKAAILALIRAGRVVRVEFVDRHRNKRERLELVELTQTHPAAAPSDHKRAASDISPIPPGATNAAHGACVSAFNATDAESDATNADSPKNSFSVGLQGRGGASQRDSSPPQA